MEFGKKIRTIREERGMTVKQLAELVECTPSFISQIEREMANPSINTLKKISVGLKVSLADLFEEESRSSDPGKKYIVRRNERKRFKSEIENTDIQLLTSSDIDSKTIEMHLLIVGPGGKSEKLYTNHSEEVGYVLKGSITILLGDNQFELKEGDSIYFPGNIPHGWENNSDTEAITLFSATPVLIGKGERLVSGNAHFIVDPLNKTCDF
ncbi:hypothetical protein CVD25_05560 [Bacillus canaveralius]|uniref:HTH cro/C1-type domain-containing protein n=1 Tax=Bacillus canaveralius TaxID=1403243 RepID=A0A2N5GL56_9BACI|nr:MULTISPECIES: cupin domain-containing protein [Bacillus]PLR82296.1 hypothetical protein CU635_12150 [Bacillus canaveralius]PLR99467.1 hypothetical protein CVD25_05560 [Bacillus canaveralius]RSK49096.1 cupin domain-containing protein [Bacillus canaveralius]